MMKKICRTFALTLIVTLMSGCMNTPTEVTEEIKRQEEMLAKDVKKEKASVKLTSVNDVVKQTPKTWKKDSGNVRFNGVVQMPDVAELYKWKVDVANETFKNPERTKDTFLKYFNNLDEKEAELQRDDVGPGMVDYIRYSEKDESLSEDELPPHLHMGEDGWLGMYPQISEPVGRGSEENMSRIKRYLFNMDGSCMEGGGDVWLIGNKVEINVQTEMDRMMSVIEDYEKIEPGIDIVPDRVEIIYYKEEDAYDIEIWGGPAYEGVRVDNAFIIQGNLNIKSYDNIYRLHTDASRYGIGDGMDNSIVIRNPYKAVEKLETYEKIIGMEDAWNLLVSKMAELKDVEFERADLMYSVWYRPEGDTTDEWYMEMDEPPKLYATPVWRFAAGLDCYVYVDAVDGTVMGYE